MLSTLAKKRPAGEFSRALTAIQSNHALGRKTIADAQDVSPETGCYDCYL
jgi:hypothetical protein